MPPQTDEFAQQDRERHKQQAPGFWVVSLFLTLALLVAFPPTVALGAPAGLAIAAAFAVVTVAYIVRLKRADGQLSERAYLAASVLATAAVAIDQWLAGGLDAPLQIMFTLHVLGGAAVLHPRQRRIHLLALSLAVAAPLAYDRFSVDALVTAVVFIALLAIQGALLADFTERLRTQRGELQTAEREASARALLDPLTGLANRRALVDALKVAESRATRSDRYTVMVLDLDGFKAYNDRFGHGAGDALLERLAQALAARVESCGRAFRLGGDEFCVLLQGRARVGDSVADAIMDALSERGPDYRIVPSCGMVVMPDDAVYADAALRLADERMYVHKRHVQRLADDAIDLLASAPAVADPPQPA